MEFLEKTRIMLEHWIKHNDHHQAEYTQLSDQLEKAGKKESARFIREMTDYQSRGTECLREALKALS